MASAKPPVQQPVQQAGDSNNHAPQMGADDIDAAQMAASEWLFLEGYRFDGPQSHAAFARAIRACSPYARSRR